ncbi:hypothetical protein ACF1B0_33365 [Streptomyces anandii]|uniref:hypothetical protein n=1 Tax=Streptomyces anandii TaxID=285454 RepID=UPI0036F5F0B4
MWCRGRRRGRRRCRSECRAFDPAFLLDGLNALTTESVDFHFTTSTKPAVLRGHGSDDHALRYLLMPIRIS